MRHFSVLLKQIQINTRNKCIPEMRPQGSNVRLGFPPNYRAVPRISAEEVARASARFSGYRTAAHPALGVQTGESAFHIGARLDRPQPTECAAHSGRQIVGGLFPREPFFFWVFVAVRVRAGILSS